MTLGAGLVGAIRLLGPPPAVTVGWRPDFEGIHGIDRSALMSLALSAWIEGGATICVAAAAGLGKPGLACALAIRLQAGRSAR